MNWIVYILECSDGTYYTGITNDLKKRLRCHNRAKGAKYTRARLPVKLIASCDDLTKSEALRLEIAVKKQKRCKKLEFIHNYKNITCGVDVRKRVEK